MNIMQRAPVNFSRVPVNFEITRSCFGRSIVVRRYSEKHEHIFGILKRANLKELEQFLDKNPKAVNYLGSDKTSPLHYLAGADPHSGIRLPVCQEPPKEFVQLLLKRGANKEALNHYDQTPLHMAAKVGYWGVAKELLKKKALVKPEMLQSALLRTVHFDPYFRVEKALLSKGIDLTKEGPMLLSRLINSIEWHIQRGLNSGNPLYSDKSRIENEHCWFIGAKLEFLLQNGADPDVLFEGKTALQAIFNRLDPAWSRRLEDRILREAVVIVAKYCKDFTACDENGWSYLHYAVHRGHHTLAKELIQKGLSIHQQDKNGLTPYHLAFTNLSGRMFVALGIDPDVTDFNTKDIPKIIQKLPPDAKSTDKYWIMRKPLEHYSMGRQFSVGFFELFGSSNRLEKEVASLYHYQEGKSIMVCALEEDNLEVVKALISKGWNVHIENDCAAFWKGKPFYSVLQEICKEPKKNKFASQIITALISESTSGITLESEFIAALSKEEEEKIYLLIDLGLTPDMVEKAFGMQFDWMIWDWFSRHFDDQRGWYETEFYPAACRIIRRLIEKGLLDMNEDFNRYL
jgi:ankyrin repeat protein